MTIGPLTTVHTPLSAYPHLREQLIDVAPAFERLAGSGAGWVRVTRLQDVAVTGRGGVCRGHRANCVRGGGHGTAEFSQGYRWVRANTCVPAGHACSAV
jgi:hypothetical protein